MTSRLHVWWQPREWPGDVCPATAKRCYETWSAAERAARLSRRRYDDVYLPYRCSACGRVHVGGDLPERFRRLRGW